jgi:uncharacterized protein (DUF1697 family)
MIHYAALFRGINVGGKNIIRALSARRFITA